MIHENYTRVPIALFESDLDAYERLVYISLCRFRDNTKDTCFPSLKKIVEISALSKSKVIAVLKSLEQKGLITVKNRKKEDGKSFTSNLYRLLDNFTKKKNPNLTLTTVKDSDKSVSAKQSTTDTFSKSDIKSDLEKSQDQILKKFKLDSIVEKNSAKTVEFAVQVVANVVCSNKKFVRVNKKNIPVSCVINKIFALTENDINYALSQFEHAKHILNRESYLLTILYLAKNQRIESIRNAQNTQKNQTKPLTKFHNFEQRNTDYDAILRSLRPKVPVV